MVVDNASRLLDTKLEFSDGVQLAHALEDSGVPSLVVWESWATKAGINNGHQFLQYVAQVVWIEHAEPKRADAQATTRLHALGPAFTAEPLDITTGINSQARVDTPSERGPVRRAMAKAPAQGPDYPVEAPF
jgi:hypothetical protein